MAPVEAILERGPAHMQSGVMVEQNPDGSWPAELRLGDPSAPQHMYRYREVGLTPVGRPVYEFVRTLPTHEP